MTVAFGIAPKLDDVKVTGPVISAVAAPAVTTTSEAFCDTTLAEIPARVAEVIWIRFVPKIVTWFPPASGPFVG